MRLLTFQTYWHRLAVATGVAALCLLPFTATRVVGFFVIAGMLTGRAIASRSHLRALESIGLGSAISPVIFGVFVLLAMWMGFDVATAARAAAAAGLLLFVLAWRSDRGFGPVNAREVTGLVALLVLAGVMSFALPLSESWWRVRDDSWWHAAVTDKLLRDGLPLTDPYFAGLRLQYMYFYHVLLGACVSITGVDVFHAMIVVNTIALVSCATAFHALAGLFAVRAGPRLLGTALWLFGMNGWFYLFFVLRAGRALVGDTHGAAVWQQMFPWHPNGHATAMSLISVEGNQFMFLDKFMLGTAFSLTLSLAAGMLFLLLSARRGRWSVRHDLALFFCTAGMLLLHPVTGVTVAVITTAVLGLLLLLRSQTPRGGPSYARLVAWLAAGVAVSVPYLRSVMPREGAGDPVRFALQPGVAVGVLAAILPALAFSALFFHRAHKDGDTHKRFGARPVSELTVSGSGMLVVWFALMLAVAVLVDLPANNETKFAYFAWLPVCALAAGCFERRWDWKRSHRVMLVGVLSAALPLHILYFHHAWRDRSDFVVTGEEQSAYAWIAANTPPDAVFIERDDRVRVPVLAHRDLYWGTESYAHQFGYPAAEINARRELRDAVFSRNGPGPDDVMQLRVLGRRVFVIYQRTPEDANSAPERFEGSPLLRGKFATTNIAVWEVILD